MRKFGNVWKVAGLAALLVAGVVGGEQARGQESKKKKTGDASQERGSEQQGGAQRENAESPERALRVLVPKIFAAWETMDIAKIERYYAKDADLTYFDIAPMKYKNWAEYRAGVQKNFFAQNSSLKGKVNDDLQVHAQGKLAWATFTFGLDMVNKQGASSHLDGRWTMILERRAGGWIVVHEHVSAPMAGG
jgi:ketosteroid isomerase-like protein